MPPTSTTTSTSEEDTNRCNNAFKNAAHRLIHCLLCHCERGIKAHGILGDLQTDELFPGLEDESFFVYYKVLIYTMVGVGVFIVLLTLWHCLF